tara:strand:- start:5853 stop:5996 length:144 start_codon:yes stop_codon:yes gene_type:complete
MIKLLIKIGFLNVQRCKGASIALWLKLINMYEPHSITRVFGYIMLYS